MKGAEDEAGSEAEPPQNERQHRAGQRAPHDDADERQPNRGGDQQPVRPIDVRERRPDGDTQEPDRAEDRAERQAGEDFAAHNPAPVSQRDLAEGQGANDQRHLPT